MSNPCPTMQSLIALGFEERDSTSGAETVGYRFVHLDINASEVMNLYGRRIVYLTGLFKTAREMDQVDFHLPTNLGSSLEAAAWVSYALKSFKSQIQPLPDWFEEGELHWYLIPFVREAWEGKQAYEASPKCFIDRDYARPLRRNLVNEISWLADEAEMTFSFDGRVLSIEVAGRVHEVVASGERWPSSFRVAVSRGSKLPARFMSSRVEVLVLGGHVILDRLSLGPCEANE